MYKVCIIGKDVATDGRSTQGIKHIILQNHYQHHFQSLIPEDKRDSKICNALFGNLMTLGTKEESIVIEEPPRRPSP